MKNARANNFFLTPENNSSRDNYARGQRCYWSITVNFVGRVHCYAGRTKYRERQMGCLLNARYELRLYRRLTDSQSRYYRLIASTPCVVTLRELSEILQR